MTPERWQQVKGLLAVALEMEADRRPQYLDEVCADDPALRLELEHLIEADQDAGSDFLSDVSKAKEGTQIGQRVGPYQIVEQIGVGGMGEVYRAFRADDQYRQQVAIKLLRAGQDSRFLVQRFRNERQVLASLEHPNIAHLLDGGTIPGGAPYFVMELVEGLPITEYCDRHTLPTYPRLELFLQVCSAVQYADQRLIIHRDLKPSNILVTAEGIPKLLDFGIAKILDPAAGDVVEPTMSMFRLLTPAYSSPEQIRGQTITTASDVYSLGVLLYEILTGHRPYPVSGRQPHEVAQAVCEVEPDKPSTVVRKTEKVEIGAIEVEVTPNSVSAVRDGTPQRLKKRLEGDLDNIVLMALRKEPPRRYASVEQFAADIRRHLSDLPVTAAKDTIPYRTSKFIRRYKTAVAAAAIVAVALIAGMVATLHEAHIARAERARAERRFNDVRRLADSMLFEVHDSIRDLPGATPARKLLVMRALEYLDRLARESSGDLSLQRELAAAYERVGDVQGNIDGPNLGDSAGAMESYRKALAIRESLAAAAGENSGPSQEELANDYERVGIALEGTGNYAAALDEFQKTLPFRERLAAARPGPESEERLAGAYFQIAYCESDLGRDQSALENYQKSATLREAITGDTPAHNAYVRMRLAGSYGYMSGIWFGKNDFARAIALEGKARDILQKLMDQDPSNARYQHYFNESSYWLAFYRQSSGDSEGALRTYRKVCADLDSFVAADPREAGAKADLARCERSLGVLLVAKGDTAHGVEDLRRALTIFNELSRIDRAHNLEKLEQVAGTFSDMADALSRAASLPRMTAAVRMARWQEARSAYLKSQETWDRIRQQVPTEPLGDGPQTVSRGISKCDAEIAKLNGPSPPR